MIDHSLVPVVTASCTIAAFLAAVLAPILQYHFAKPRLFLGGFAIRFLGTADTQWAGLPQAIAAIRTVLDRHEYHHELDELWIDVIGGNDTLSVSSAPKGYFQDPRNGGRRYLNGAPTVRSYVYGLIKRNAVVVRQIHASPTQQPDGSYRQDGALLDAGVSALFHEVAERALPIVTQEIGRTGDPYWTAPKFEALRTEMEREYARLRGAG